MEKGDLVQVLINNPEKNNAKEWRDGVVNKETFIQPEKGRPYKMVIVDYIRTYCKSVWNKETFTSDLTFYDAPNTEGFININESTKKVW